MNCVVGIFLPLQHIHDCVVSFVDFEWGVGCFEGALHADGRGGLGVSA